MKSYMFEYLFMNTLRKTGLKNNEIKFLTDKNNI